MPRLLRIEFAGARYHVMNRGSRFQPIFLDDVDREAFIALLAFICERFGVRVLSYCLMGNHYHLFLETPEANISKAMQFLGSSYTKHFNMRHGFDGPLCRGRFKSIVVGSGFYQLAVTRYIALNPVAAGLSSNAANYRWSSTAAILGLAPSPNWLETEYVLSLADGGRAGLAELINAGGAQEELDLLYHPINFERTTIDDIFASAEDIAKLSARVEHLNAWTSLPSTDRLERVDLSVVAEFNVDPASIYASARGRLNYPRLAAISLAREFEAGTPLELACWYGVASPSSIRSATQRFRKVLGTDPFSREKVERCRNQLSSDD